MSSLNRVQIIGRLGQQPELKHLPSGSAVLNLSVATSERWKDKDGEKQERTEWHRVTLFGRPAEVAAQYLQKGSLAYFEGRLQTRKYKRKEGTEAQVTEIISDRMVMLDSKGTGSGKPAAKPAPQPEPEAPEAFDDDIPF
jgi:single-strand DNA-binding protein